MKEIDKIALIETRNGQILSTRSKGKANFYLPGGKRDPGESDEQALTRELKEELNVEVRPDSMKFVGTFEAQADGAKDGIIVKMTCYEAQYDGVPEASGEIEEVRWLGYKDMDIVSEVDKKIFKFLKAEGKLA